MSEIAPRIRIAREAAGLSQEVVAQSLGVHLRTVTRYESGETVPQKRFLPAIAKTLGVRIEWLTTGEGQMGVSSPYRFENGRYSMGEGDPGLSRDPYVLGDDEDTVDPRTSPGTGIAAAILARAVLVPSVDLSLQPSGDPILSDRTDVEARARADADGVIRIMMPTDAMEPVISAGAAVDAVPTDTYVGAGIYVYTLDGRPDVGRVQTGPGGRLILSFENQAYQTYSLIPEGDAYVEAETGLRTTLAFRARIAGSYRAH